MRKYVYNLSAPVRQRGALGLGEQKRFLVLLDTPTASFQQVTNGWEQQYPPTAEICYWQDDADITINGEETFGCGDRLFPAERAIADADGHDRMARLRGME